MPTTTPQAPSGVPASIANPTPGVVTVWSDIGCPWATLACHVLHDAAATSGTALVIDHRAFPLERFNARPTPKPILDTEMVAIVGLNPELGWRSWSAPDWTYPVTTLPALCAVQAAKQSAVGGLAASTQLDAALRHAWYVEGRCVSLEATILDVAEGCDQLDGAALAAALATGSGRRAVEAQWDGARSRWVRGSPHLFVNGLSLHNPGATYHWTGPAAEGGVPRLDAYSATWAADVLAAVRRGTADAK